MVRDYVFSKPSTLSRRLSKVHCSSMDTFLAVTYLPVVKDLIAGEINTPANDDSNDEDDNRQDNAGEGPSLGKQTPAQPVQSINTYLTFSI